MAMVTAATAANTQHCLRAYGWFYIYTHISAILKWLHLVFANGTIKMWMRFSLDSGRNLMCMFKYALAHSLYNAHVHTLCI